uniref:Uncharacterized protein n=1 Tax=Setaria italica TaxID=4555 RepID=K3Y4I5_SETIT
MHEGPRSEDDATNTLLGKVLLQLLTICCSAPTT